VVLVGFLLTKLPQGFSIGKSPTPVPVQKLLDEAESSLAQKDELKAKEAYNQILSEHPDYDGIEEIQTKLGELNMSIIFSKMETPQTEIYQVQPGDSLGKLAKKYNTTKELIQKSNGLKSDVIRVGAKLRIWKAPFSVVVHKSQNISILKSGDEIIKIYRVSTGKDNKENMTPVGTFTIASKIVNPVWFKPNGQPIPPESPENELGTRWMGFAEDTHYGLHGTIHPEAIGTNATAGCVRLENSDVEQLFDLLPVGTKVMIQE
jgi:lipoprotein-anchoring transpeptidase ErfK/SrfK